MIVFAGAVLVLPDRVINGGSLVISDGRIQSIHDRAIDRPAGATYLDLAGHVIVPGFIDVHVHGVEGVKFYTRTKVVTSRWPNQDTPAPGFHMPTLG